MTVVKAEKDPLWKTVLYFIAGIAAANIYWRLSYISVYFIEIFSDLNSSLPFLIQFILQSRIPFFVLNAASVALLLAYFFTLFNQNDYPFIRKMIKLNFLLACVLLVLTMVVIFLPILSQGKVF